jgi:DNA (cytosine-5)-methyltransferase 1
MTNVHQRKLERIKKGELPRVLDLFAGAGGLSLGFKTAGFEIIAALEIDEEASQTHALNFFKGHLESLHGQARDITKLEPLDLMRDYGFENPIEAVDVIIGGPPCQAFARVGRAKLREIADHPDAFLQDIRANLYLRFIHYVKELSPLAILMENVPDALNYGGHNIAEETCELFDSIGYECNYTLLNAAYYGVPQMRERMFLIAYAKELEAKVQFPEPTNWIELPQGYKGTRSVALKSLKNQENQPNFLNEHPSYFILPPKPKQEDLPYANTVQDALSDLPAIYAQQLLENGLLRRGVQNPNQLTYYNGVKNLHPYAHIMRNWRNYKTAELVTGHVIRYLPRDYKLFAKMRPGDQYPEAHKLAISLFEEQMADEIAPGIEIDKNSEKYKELWDKFVPPYDPGKFPNKWRKMESDQPARTVMAHIGKDSYSHIHYDSSQARTISLRETARIQSFPDGFTFAGKMNAALKQIGNAVPPLLAYRIASKIKTAFKQEPLSLTECITE